MNFRKLVVALTLLLVFYSLVSVFFKSAGNAYMRSGNEGTMIVREPSAAMNNGTEYLPRTLNAIRQDTSRRVPQTTEKKSDYKSTYNVSFAPEYYALRRPLEKTTSKIPELDRKSIARLEAVATTASKQNEAVKRFPTTLIIGVRKAGTRALLAILNIHPQVKSCGPEVHFFDQRYPRGLLWYLSQTPDVLHEQQTIEKTPSYFVVQDVPQRILAYSKAINKTLKFLVIFRDPTIRAVSDYVQLRIGTRAKYNKDLPPFEHMVTKNQTTGEIDTAWSVIKTGVYSKHLERWLKFFPLDWFHFVSGEELVKNPFGEVKKVEQFLGLEPFFKEDNFVFNPKKGFPCFRRPNEKSNSRCLGKAKGRAHPTVDARILNELRRYYRPFNKQLYEMVGRDFQWP